jgi:hypothetical protein
MADVYFTTLWSTIYCLQRRRNVVPTPVSSLFYNPPLPLFHHISIGMRRNELSSDYAPISCPLPAPTPFPFSSIPPPFPPPELSRAASNSSSLTLLSLGSGANSSIVRMTRSHEDRKVLVARRSRRTVVALYVLDFSSLRSAKNRRAEMGGGRRRRGLTL